MYLFHIVIVIFESNSHCTFCSIFQPMCAFTHTHTSTIVHNTERDRLCSPLFNQHVLYHSRSASADELIISRPLEWLGVHSVVWSGSSFPNVSNRVTSCVKYTQRQRDDIRLTDSIAMTCVCVNQNAASESVWAASFRSVPHNRTIT